MYRILKQQQVTVNTDRKHVRSNQDCVLNTEACLQLSSVDMYAEGALMPKNSHLSHLDCMLTASVRIYRLTRRREGQAEDEKDRRSRIRACMEVVEEEQHALPDRRLLHGVLCSVKHFCSALLRVCVHH